MNSVYITSPLPLYLFLTCFSQSSFFIPHLSLSLSLPTTSASLSLSLSLSQSQGHAGQIDYTLIANVMMLQSTHLTCLINTTAATSLLLPHIHKCTRTHTRRLPERQSVLTSSYHVLSPYIWDKTWCDMSSLSNNWRDTPSCACREQWRCSHCKQSIEFQTYKKLTLRDLIFIFQLSKHSTYNRYCTSYKHHSSKMQKIKWVWMRSVM